MRILIVHQIVPGQHPHLGPHWWFAASMWWPLADRWLNRSVSHATLHCYNPETAGGVPSCPDWVTVSQTKVLRAEAVAILIEALKAMSLRVNLAIGNPAWGDFLPSRM